MVGAHRHSGKQNAGLESSKPFLEIGLAEYERVMRINTTGAWLCCQAVIPVMQRQKSGCILNVSSVPASAAAACSVLQLIRLQRGP